MTDGEALMALAGLVGEAQSAAGMLESLGAKAAADEVRGVAAEGHAALEHLKQRITGGSTK